MPEPTTVPMTAEPRAPAPAPAPPRHGEPARADADARDATLREVGALLEGHFLLTSGRHAARYFQAMRLLERPRLCDAAAADVVRALGAAPAAPLDLVTATLAPAVGGIVWGHAVARALDGALRRGGAAGPCAAAGVRALFAERVEGRMVLRRGFALAPGDVVLLCEDVVTTGGTVAELGALVEAAGARVAGVAAVADRSGGAHGLPWPLVAWVSLDAPTWDAAACPLCRAGAAPPVKPGSRGIA